MLKKIPDHWFWTIVAVLATVLLLNLFGGFRYAKLWWIARHARSLATDAQAWQSWLDAHGDLFDSLAVGAKIGVTRNRESDYGLLWEKTANGISVYRANLLRQEAPGLIFEFDDQVAKDWRWKKTRAEAVEFLRHRGQIGILKVYFLKNPDQLKAQGLAAFLEEIQLQAQ